MRQTPRTIQMPIQNPIVTNTELVTREWSDYFAEIQDALNSLGIEQYFKIVNNTAIADDVEGMSFDCGRVSQVTIDYLIQRVTDSAELIESGIMIAVYMAGSSDWEIFDLGTPGPDDAGVTFSITSGGQVQYTSTNVGGTEAISKITFRARTLAAKNSLYSKAGR